MSLSLDSQRPTSFKKNLTLRDPVRAIKEVSHDPTCKRELQLDSGKRMTGVQIQAEYLESALQYLSSRSVDPVMKDVMTKWQHVMECLARDPMELNQQIDWVMKQSVIESFMDRKSLDWNSPQVEMMDLG